MESQSTRLERSKKRKREVNELESNGRSSKENGVGVRELIGETHEVTCTVKRSFESVSEEVREGMDLGSGRDSPPKT